MSGAQDTTDKAAKRKAIDEELERLKQAAALQERKKRQAEKERLGVDFLGSALDGCGLDDYVEDSVIAPPQATPGMFYGFIGELAKLAAKDTEINPVAAALVYLSFLGANVGRDTFLLINSTYHHPRLFTLHVGRSGRGGKGDSQQLTQRIRRRIEALDSSLLGITHAGGLSSREGLAA